MSNALVSFWFLNLLTMQCSSAQVSKKNDEGYSPEVLTGGHKLVAEPNGDSG